jgi:hypothetical protein
MDLLCPLVAGRSLGVIAGVVLQGRQPAAARPEISWYLPSARCKRSRLSIYFDRLYMHLLLDWTCVPRHLSVYLLNLLSCS